jgi:hypothetical protein
MSNTVVIHFCLREIWIARIQKAINSLETEMKVEHEKYTMRYNSKPRWYQIILMPAPSDPLDWNEPYYHFSPVRGLERILKVIKTQDWEEYHMDTRDYTYILENAGE